MSECENEAIQQDSWRIVYDLWAKWQYHEAAERGYDAKAAQAARDKFNQARSAYEIRYAQLWEENRCTIT